MPRPRPPKARPRARSLGFTLIELLAVLIILGILATLIIPRYVSFVEQTRETIAQTAANEGVDRFKSASQRYLLETGMRPSSVDDVAGPDYLDLDGGGRTNTGAFDISYTRVVGRLRVSAHNPGEALALANATIPWP